MPSAITRATVVLAISQVMGWGTSFYLPGIIGRDIARELGLSTEYVFAGITMMVVTGGLLSPRVGKIFDERGTPTLMAFGSVLMGLSLAVLGLAQGALSYAVAWFGIGVASTFCLSLGSMTSIAQIAGPEARKRMGILMLFTGIGGSLSWPLTAAIEVSLGWRGVCFVYALVNIVGLASLHYFTLPRDRYDGDGHPDAPPPPQGAIPEERRADVFVWLSLGLTSAGFVSWGSTLNLLDWLTALGQPAGFALTLASSVGFIQVSARWFDFFVARSMTPPVVGLIGAIIMFVGFLPAIFVGHLALGAAAFVALYAFASGSLSVTRATVPLWAFGSGQYGRNAGRLAFFQNCAFGVAPVIFAFALDRGGPIAALIVGMAASVIAMVSLGIVIVKARRWQKDETLASSPPIP